MDKPKTVTVEALEAHTAFGKSYDVGDTYDVDEQIVETLRIQGKAVRVDRVAHAKKQAKEAEETVKARTAVKPMTTDDIKAPKTKAAKKSRR